MMKSIPEIALRVDKEQRQLLVARVRGAQAFAVRDAVQLLASAICELCDPDRGPRTLRCAGAGGPPPAVDLGQRLVVLRCLEAQCGDGQLLVDLFVNYDCDLEGANLFERMVAALVRIAQTPPSPDAHAQVVDDERALRVLVRRP